MKRKLSFAARAVSRCVLFKSTCDFECKTCSRCGFISLLGIYICFMPMHCSTGFNWACCGPGRTGRWPESPERRERLPSDLAATSIFEPKTPSGYDLSDPRDLLNFWLYADIRLVRLECLRSLAKQGRVWPRCQESRKHKVTLLSVMVGRKHERCCRPTTSGVSAS